MTHTPGPWRKGPTHKDGTYAVHADKASVIHAKPFSSSNGSAEANARLIAAAPDMLKELEDTANYLEAFHDNLIANDVDMLIDKNQSPRVVADRIRAAIAQAKGEEK